VVVCCNLPALFWLHGHCLFSSLCSAFTLHWICGDHGNCYSSKRYDFIQIIGYHVVASYTTGQDFQSRFVSKLNLSRKNTQRICQICMLESRWKIKHSNQRVKQVYGTWFSYLICCSVVIFSWWRLGLLNFVLQPTKLNVFKNDDETWDYTGALGKLKKIAISCLKLNLV